MRINFEIATAMQYELKALRARVRQFESGGEYRRMEERHEKELKSLRQTISQLRRELYEERISHIRMRDRWFEASDDLEKEFRKELMAKDRVIERLEKRVSELILERDEEKKKRREKQLELYAVQTKLEEADGLVRKLTAQINRDFENSSIPSSMQGPKRKKITNSREKSGRKPGGQPGHKGACRKKQKPTEKILLPPPEEYLTEKYYKTKKQVKKQMVKLHVVLEVIEYTADIYRNRETGAKVHAPFPEGVVDEVNYDGSVSAFLHLLCTECNVSGEKAQRFLKEITHGELDVSAGMINSLHGCFADKSSPEKKELIHKLVASPVMNADFTNANVNGEGKQVLILASPGTPARLFIGRDQKGHKGIEGTPLEKYVGTVVHDHDRTFYSYGLKHQECHQHNLRYLKGSIENEPEREWNRKMQDLIRRMLHYRKQTGGGDMDPGVIAGFEEEFDAVLMEAKREYEEEPPGEYYREGYNLYRRLEEFRESQLLFLHDKNVPPDNSRCERGARIYKRKQKQAISFRSRESFMALCDALSVIYTMREEGKDVYAETTAIFNRPRKENAHRFQKAEAVLA